MEIPLPERVFILKWFPELFGAVCIPRFKSDNILVLSSMLKLIHLAAIMICPCITLHWIQQWIDWGRIEIIVEIYKRQPISQPHGSAMGWVLRIQLKIDIVITTVPYWISLWACVGPPSVTLLWHSIVSVQYGGKHEIDFTKMIFVCNQGKYFL